MDSKFESEFNSHHDYSLLFWDWIHLYQNGNMCIDV